MEFIHEDDYSEDQFNKEFTLEDLDSNQDCSLVENKQIKELRGDQRTQKVLVNLKLNHLERQTHHVRI